MGAPRYILEQTLRDILHEASQRCANRFTRAARLSPLTRKMLQLIKKTLDPATCTVVRATKLNLMLGLTLGLAVTVSAGARAASAQATGPSGSQSSSQTSSPTDGQSGAPPANQTGSQAQPPTAAPGTVAVSKATAAALAPYTGPKYDNRWEVYGGLLFMNGQAGQNTPVRFNMGGAEAMGTYWWTKHLGVAVDGRFGAGTTPVISPYYNRVVVMDSAITGGVQYRGPKNRYAAIDFHVLGGGIYEDSTYAVNHFPVTAAYPSGSPYSACAAQENPNNQKGNLGLYCDHAAPYGTVGGSIDFNESAKLAIRLQPDLTFEHLGTETREYFSISMGVVYRIGKRKDK